MSAFRKLVLTFGAVAISMVPAWGQLPGLDGVAADIVGGITYPAPFIAPQTVLCSVSQQPLTVRVEGLAELLGDVVINCTGSLRANSRNFIGVIPVGYSSPAAVMPTINIGLTLSVPLTSRLTSDPLTEALLFVDEPLSAGPLNTVSDRNVQNPCTGGGGVCTTYVHDGTTVTVAGGAIVATPTIVQDSLYGAGSSNQAVGSANGGGIAVNVFQGRRTNNQTVTFQGVPLGFIDTRGNPRLLAEYLRIRAAGGGVYRGEEIRVNVNKTYRIKNVRGAIAGAASVNAQVFANVQIENPSGNLQLSSASTVVGNVLQGLSFRLRNTASSDAPASGLVNLASCVTVNRDLAVTDDDADPWNGGNFSVQFTELYGVAFRPRGYTAGQPAACAAGVTVGCDQTLPNFNYNTESGFYNTQWIGLANGLGSAGIADHGTVLRAVFNNIPANVKLFSSVAGTAGTTSTLGAYAIGNIQGNPFLSTAAIAPTALGGSVVSGAAIPTPSFLAASSLNGIVNLPVTTGRAGQAWEVYAANPATIEAINFIIGVAYRAANNPGLGTTTVQGTYATINTQATAGGAGVAIPRFVETGSAITAFSIGPCLTNLLFPFVTNQAGFNTGIAISNTSLTNPGTGELFGLDANNGVSPQSGTCTMNYFGTTGADGAAPPPATTGIIPAGRTFVMTLASGSSGPFGTVPAAQNFQGYAIAQCNFRYAHGYAFISDIGASQLAQGYLALILDGALGHRTGNLSESLGN